MSFSRTFRIIFHRTFTIVSRALSKPILLDFYVRTLCYFRTLFIRIVTIVSRARLEFSLIEMLREYLTHRILFHRNVILLSRAL